MQAHLNNMQALPILQAKFAIKRALMRLQIQVPQSCKAEAIELLAKLEADVETKDFSASQVSRAYREAAAGVPCLSCRSSKVKHVIHHSVEAAMRWCA